MTLFASKSIKPNKTYFNQDKSEPIRKSSENGTYYDMDPDSVATKISKEVIKGIEKDFKKK